MRLGHRETRTPSTLDESSADNAATPRRRSFLSNRRVAVVVGAAAAFALVGGYMVTNSQSQAEAAAASPLAFNVPAAATSSGKLVFAHYFTPYPLSLDNKPSASDYYAINYLKPTGEKSKFASFGGLLRDRPEPTAVLSGSSWRLQNMEKEVRTAIAAGINGFTIDLLASESVSQNGAAVVTMLQAAHNVDPSFKIVLMPDMNGALRSVSQQLRRNYAPNDFDRRHNFCRVVLPTSCPLGPASVFLSAWLSGTRGGWLQGFWRRLCRLGSAVHGHGEQQSEHSRRNADSEPGRPIPCAASNWRRQSVVRSNVVHPAYRLRGNLHAP